MYVVCLHFVRPKVNDCTYIDEKSTVTGKAYKKRKKIAPSLSNASQMCVVRMLVNYNCTHTVRVKIALVSKVLRK